MKIYASILALACLAPLANAAPAKPRLVGSVYPAGPTQTSTLWLGGAYFPGKGYRSDVQSKWALYPGTRWQLFGLNGIGPAVSSGKMLPPDVPVGYAANLRQAVSGDRMMIAVANAYSSAQPRLPRAQNMNQENYQRVAAELLRAQGLNISRAKLTQLLRVDLNGDGIEEVLMTARSRSDYGDVPGEKRGDYSLVGLRTVDRGKVKSVTLASGISTKDAGFSAPSNYEVLACVDVDGDGQMEVIVQTDYYEGWGFEVWQFDGCGIKRVISAGWGV